MILYVNIMVSYSLSMQLLLQGATANSDFIPRHSIVERKCCQTVWHLPVLWQHCFLMRAFIQI